MLTYLPAGFEEVTRGEYQVSVRYFFDISCGQCSQVPYGISDDNLSLRVKFENFPISVKFRFQSFAVKVSDNHFVIDFEWGVFSNIPLVVFASIFQDIGHVACP